MPILTQSFSFEMAPVGCNIVPLKMDDQGIIPENLEETLSHWPKPDDNQPSRGKLKALYMIPNGGNPTGTRYSLERKQQIYKLAHEYNFLILEDEAYFFLERRVCTIIHLILIVFNRNVITNACFQLKQIFSILG